MGDIAIDDITYKSGVCGSASTPAPRTTRTTSRLPPSDASAIICNFDRNDTCYWQYDPSGQFSWTLNAGRSPTVLTGPSADHTTESDKGFYAYIESSSPQKPNDTARLTSPYVNVQSSVGSCFKFFYHMYGADINALRVYAQFSNGSSFGTRPIWQKRNNRGNQWLFGAVKIDPTYYRVKFMIEGVVGNGPYGDIAIDDLDYSDGDCPRQNECDFESADLCGYTRASTARDFNWERVQGSAVRPDHTYGSDFGHYMSAKTVSPHDNKRIARLLTTKLSAQQTVCVNFWYKISKSGLLNIRTFSANKYSQKTLYSADGNRDYEWSLGRVTAVDSIEYQVAFEAYDTTNTDGEVFLDDVEYTFKACEPVASCDFEDANNPLCGYRFRTADFDWVVLPGQFASIQSIWSVPDKDHTTGDASGHFLFLDTNDKQAGKRAWMESEVIGENTGDMCLQFYLRTNQVNQATLNVQLKNKINSVQSQKYTSTGEHTSEQWSMREVQFSSSQVPYSILFEGVVGVNPNKDKGQLALDDINFYQGSCRTNTTIGPTNPTQTTNTPTYAPVKTTSALGPTKPQTPPTCTSGYCLNGGTCSVLNNSLKCKCTGNFTGDRCEIDKDQKPNNDDTNSKIFIHL
jgi:hypothetical protein